MRLPTITLLLGLAIPTQAAVTFDVVYGLVYDSADALVSDGTLWVMVADTDGVSGFNGFSTFDTGTTQGSNLTDSSSFSAVNTMTVGKDFAGQESGDRIFAMGAFNGTTSLGTAGALSETLSNVSLDPNTNGTGAATSMQFALYWFPGVNYTGVLSTSVGTVSNPIGTEVGGIAMSTDDSGSFKATILPQNTDGTFTDFRGVGTADAGGTVGNDKMTAIMIIPEPSALVLIGLSGLLLLRRKRTS